MTGRRSRVAGQHASVRTGARLSIAPPTSESPDTPFTTAKQGRVPVVELVSQIANSATGRLAGHPGVVGDLAADPLCRGGGSRGCACWEADPRRLASAPNCHLRGEAATRSDPNVAAGRDESRDT